MDVIELTSLLGNIGKFFGAIAVVVTLIYLATQFRQNNNAITGSMEMEMEMDFSREVTAWHSRITADPELIKLYDKGAQNAQMPGAEKSRYVWMMELGGASDLQVFNNPVIPFAATAKGVPQFFGFTIR